MKKFYAIAVSLFAVFAFCAVAAGSASAEEFLANGKAITEELASEGSGELTLTVLATATTIGAAILCSGIFDGTVGPGRFDLITKLLNLAKEEISGTALSGLALNCTVTVSLLSLCSTVGSLAEVWAVNLPWLTELLLMTGTPEWLIDILNGGNGNPGWYVLCANGKHQQCTGATSSSAANETGGLLEEFNSAAPIESEKIECEEGGPGAGDFEGSGLEVLTNGETLSVS